MWSAFGTRSWYWAQDNRALHFVFQTIGEHRVSCCMPTAEAVTSYAVRACGHCADAWTDSALGSSSLDRRNGYPMALR
jgi:hypothetical protein